MKNLTKTLNSGLVVNHNEYYYILDFKYKNIEEFLLIVSENKLPESINNMTENEYLKLLGILKNLGYLN